MRVCILGNGLSSLTLAKALVNQKIYVDLYQSKKKLSFSKGRTLGISKSNVDYFNSEILNIEKLLWNLKKIEIFSDNLMHQKLINFENNNNHLFSIVKNYDLMKVMQKSFNGNKYIKKISTFKNFNHSNYDLVINTEYNNFISKKYFSKKIIKKYNSYAYTALIEHDKIFNNIATQIFTKRGPLAFLPLSETETSIVYSIHNSKRDEKENFNNLINFYNFKYKIKKISKINQFELNSFILRSYYHKNILAFGDLLHKIHPLAGQGFNMTIRDVSIFLQIIKSKIGLGLPLDMSVNIEFEKKTRHKNLIFSNGIDFVHEFFNLERKTNNSILSKSIQVLGKNPSVNKIFRSIADKGIIV